MRASKSTSTFAAAFVAVLVAGLGLGCSGTSAPYPAHGSVTVGGKPTEGLVVTLIPTAPSDGTTTAYPSGKTDADGKYVLSTFAPGDGAPAGEYKLTLAWMEAQKGPDAAVAAAQGEGSTDRFGSRYADPAKSEWTVKIGSDENAIPPIDVPPVH